MKTILGIDIGGTAVKMGLVDETGTVLAKTEASVSFDGYKTPILQTVLKTTEAFLQAQGATAPAGIGVSATGQIDCVQGAVVGTGGNLPGWEYVPIKQTLEAKFGLPVRVANDANCVCLAECWVGAAKGCTDVVCITLGTGLGGGILTGGRLLTGARGLGGELGHMPIHALDGVPCSCGRRGCWEKYAATTALIRSAKAQNPDFVDGRTLFTAAEAGDGAALKLLDHWMDEITAGLVGLVHLFNPQLVLVGGGVSAQQKLLIEPLAAKVKAAVMPAFAKNLELKAAELKNDAGTVGAAYYFLQNEAE